MVVYVLMYKYKSGSFGLLDVFYTREDAEKYRDICIKIDKINHAENDTEYRIERIKIEKFVQNDYWQIVESMV